LSIDPLNPLYANGGGGAAPAPTEQELDQQAMLSKELDHTFGAPAADTSFDDFNLPAEAPTALPELDSTTHAEPQPEAQAKAADEHVLDFDLGGLSFEPVSTTEPIAMPGPDEQARAEQDATAVPDLEFDAAPVAATEPAPPVEAAKPAADAEESYDLAFDMNFDAPAATAPSAPQPQEKDDLALDMSLDASPPAIDMADLAKEFDLPELPKAADEGTPAGDKDPLFDLDTMDFSLPETPVLKEPAASLGDEAAAEDDPFALPDLPGANSSNGTASQFDLSDIDLDLPGGATPAPLPEVEMAGGRDGEMSASHMEMETKLDLAIAYQEIGDKEGARELLDEVIKGGSSEQVSKATALREKLA
jgi:pilus assembly protein FimV